MSKQRFIPFILKYALLVALLLVGFAQLRVETVSRGRIYDGVDEVPVRPVGLLLGTSRYTRSGSPSPFFDARIRAAAELYHRGRIGVILASGDNAHISYNEPVEMRRALERAGVPTDAIVKDFAGFRTLDSVARAQLVFGQMQLTIISQRFHLGRALLTAHHYSIDAIGYAADPVGGYPGLRVWVREVLARTLAVLDLYVFGTQPRYTGDPVPIGPPAQPLIDAEAADED